MSELQRQLTGVPGLDDCLGGGLLPGTLTVIVGCLLYTSDAADE